jgi:mycolipenoyl-CoA---2-(long-chain-fatty acyl)-trehalose mycolipenoyltransferase / long-chain-acyl-CoA---trehalose acyltransferase
VFELTAIQDWVDAPGTHVSWGPSRMTRKKVAEAPVHDVPPSYQQAQHLRSYREHTAKGAQMARLTIPAWNVAGQCDIRAMTHVINAYLRRHDTYRSRFEFTVDDRIVRRKVRNPRDISFVHTDHGVHGAADWRDHILTTPGPLEWDCFRFGIIQRPDHFTVYMCVDHLHVDATFMGLMLVEIHLMYAALVGGGAPIPLPPAGSYDEYCLRQRRFTSGLTLDSPEVRDWIAFAEGNGGTLPRFPLPLGDLPSSAGDLLTVQLLDAAQSHQFESACLAAGVRFIGGVFACAALAQQHLTGIGTYYVITPTSTRATEAETMTTGWFTGTVPVTVPVGSSFADTARTAQSSFDSGLHLAHVPFDRVLELAASERGLRRPDPGVPMVSYLDATAAPLSPAVVAEWNALQGRIYSEMGAANQIGMWVNQFGSGTSVTVAFPNNPIARESVTRYVEAMKSIYIRVAAGQGEMVSVGQFSDLDLRSA